MKTLITFGCLIIVFLFSSLNMRAQDFSGVWFIANADKYSLGNQNNYYLVPARDPQQPHYADAYFHPQYCNSSGSGDYTGSNYGDPEQPFLTTHKNDDPSDTQNLLWRLEPTGDGSSYYVIHVLTGKYVVYEPPYKDAVNRKSMHLLETNSPGDNAKFAITGNAPGPINIRPKSIGTGNRFWNPAANNSNNYYGASNDYFHQGMVGVYNQTTGNSRWYLEADLLAPPTIEANAENKEVIFTALQEGVTIYYTFDGSVPDNTCSSVSYPGGTVSVGPYKRTVKAVAFKNGNYSAVTVLQVDFREVLDITSLDEIVDPDGWYRLVADVNDASGYTTINTFTGSLDGQFHTITGLTQPLFDTIDGGWVDGGLAKVCNLIFKDVNIDHEGNTGAIAGTATGNVVIYNCGILSGSVGGTGDTGGLVGWLRQTPYNGYHDEFVYPNGIYAFTRVVNCYSFANITSAGEYAAGIVGNNDYGSTTANYQNTNSRLRTMVSNCLFYGDILGGENKYPVYGNKLLSSDGAQGLNNYTYFIGSVATFDDAYTSIEQYNRSWPVKEEHLTRFEYYRSILNSNRILMTWYVTGKTATEQTDEDRALIGKWVLDQSIAPYPILKPWGKYPSIINADPEQVWDTLTKSWIRRETAQPYQGKKLGVLTVNVNAGSNNSSAAVKTLQLPILDMDTLNYDYGYAKVQLPYYNEQFGNPAATNHAERYGNNYTDKVVTGWKVTSVTGGVPGTFEAHWEHGYNFADRYCTNKDLYSVSGRVFAQGGYYYVPEGVTSITIEAYWGNAVYVHNAENSVDRVAVAGKHFSPAGTLPTTFNGQPVYAGLANAVNQLQPEGSGSSALTVYDQAVVLVGNLQHLNGNSANILGWNGNTQDFATNNKPMTVTSVDLDFDNEPDFCFELQCGQKTNRVSVHPIRFDFLSVPSLGMAIRNNAVLYSIGIFAMCGHFEITETAFMRAGQFEYDGRLDRPKEEAPLILNGGEFEQFVSTSSWKRTDGPVNCTKYCILGGHLWMKEFTPGKHGDLDVATRHCAVSVMGGEYGRFCLSGVFITSTFHGNDPDNPHCYTNGGKFGTMTGAGMEDVKGDVIFKIDHSVIREFYGGGLNAAMPITGNINVTVNNSIVRKYCGGPFTGDMLTGTSVTTSANNTIFGEYYGGGNGGTNFSRNRLYNGNFEASNVTESLWRNEGGFDGFTPLNYVNGTMGYQSQFEFELIDISTGYVNTTEDHVVARTYRHDAQFTATQVEEVNSTLLDCTVLNNFYGGGNLGKVSGDVVSTLMNTRVCGSAFGGGNSSEVPSFAIHDKNTVVFPYRDIVSITHPGSLDYVRDDGEIRYYKWIHDLPEGVTANVQHPDFQYEGEWYCYTEKDMTNLGSVGGNTSITVNGTSVIEGNLFGAGNMSAVLQNTTAVVDEQAHVMGSVYGGGNLANTGGNTQVQMKNGTVGIQGNEDVFTGNLFGGGKGTLTDLTKAQVEGNTNVVVSGGDVVRNVYGGGELGQVLGQTDVLVINGANLNNVYGAGKGDPESTERSNANISLGTRVTLVNGQVKGNIFGGGENGSVGIGSSKVNAEGVSVININGGKVLGSVFGGGSMGYTEGNTIVNINDGVVNQHVFGGAFGTRGIVYVAGLRMVNMRGGTVYNNVYGGSRNADDALVFEPGAFDASTDLDVASVVNISGGHVYKQVFASGYFGNVYGSTCAFIGTNAIMNAPNHAANAEGAYNQAYFEEHKALILDGSIWAGGDFGNYDGNAFGEPTISGRSDLYVDGHGYKTDANTTADDDSYMNINGSLYGCGTSCDAGKQGRRIVVREFGEPVANPDYAKDNYVEPYLKATRSLYSIQRADSLIIDAAHIDLLGQGRVNSLITTEKYAIHELGSVVRIINGSSLFLNYPIDQIKKIGFYTCDDIYSHPNYDKVQNDDLPTAGYDNKLRVNDGSYVAVRYNDIYGELEGFAFVMTDAFNNTLAYARPKQSQEIGNILPSNHPEYDNPNDGGFVSYISEYNIYDLAGVLITEGNSKQLRYENHTPDLRDDSEYFRVWRYGDIYSHRDGVFNVIAKNEEGFSTVDVVIDMPAGSNGSYFRIKSIHGMPDINYGTDVMLVNAASYGSTTASDWMYFDHFLEGDYISNLAVDHDSIVANTEQMLLSPNNTFGLVAIPQGSLEGVGNSTLLFHPFADSKIISEQWDNVDISSNPSILFRLTYNNQLTGNFTWAPIVIVFQQVKEVGGEVTLIDEVTVSLTINTTTSIEQDITGQAFALMSGNGTDHDTYLTNVMAPAYLLHMTEIADLSQWYLTNVKWTKREQTEEEVAASINVPYQFVEDSDYVGSTEKFGLTLKPALNVDNSTGWSNNISVIPALDAYEYLNNDGGAKEPYFLGETDGRYPIAFDFVLNFDGSEWADNDYMGMLEFDMFFTNYINGDPENEYRRDFKLYLRVYRRGQGNRYYIDGVHGRNDYSGTYPNAAKPNLACVLNFSDFQPGDEIYIVNTVTVNDVNGLNWFGQEYGMLNIYRYPGGHSVYHGIDNQPHWTEYDIVNNPAFLGPLLNVYTSLNLSSIILDGSSEEHTSLNYDTDPAVVADAPMIIVQEGASVTIQANSSLQHNNNNSTNGGAVFVDDQGSLTIYDGSQLVNNSVGSGEGGGVYLSSTAQMLVSNLVTIDENHKGEDNNNVYLEDYQTLIQVGTANPNDIFEALDAGSRIGITKQDWGENGSYMPILYSDEGMEHLGNLPNQTIVFDDQSVYTVEKLESVDPEHHLYFVKTWTNVQRTAPAGFNAATIDTPEELAWAISLVNGLNGVSAQPDLNLTLTDNIDMSAQMWEAIGNENHPYSGTFNGNGHSITGINSMLTRDYLGLFGKTNNAKVSDVIVNADFGEGTGTYLGTIIGAMTDGSLSNVEAGGTLHANASTIAMGGLVGKAESGLIHSAFAVNTMAGNDVTYIGGLVGFNQANLYNSYSNVFVNGNDKTGGLVGMNYGLVENCYSVLGDMTCPAFACENEGTILYCYSDHQENGYVGLGHEPSGHGTYAPVLDRHAYGYFYDDNRVNAENDYIVSDLTYANNHIDKWPGMLCALNEWVKANSDDIVYTPWMRPTSQDINGDLPVLVFPKDACMATTDGKFLDYNADLDAMLDIYNDNGDEDAEPETHFFLYKNAIDVERVPKDNVNVIINEDVVLLQASSAGKFKNTTVGVSFDNSCGAATDFFGNTLAYDWHTFSTPLANAPLGISYSNDSINYWDGDDQTNQVTDVANSYLPNGVTNVAHWDFYSFYEPEYHWINLKRNSASHHHFDGSHEHINYTNEDTLVAGKGYLAAIDKDSYLCNTGTLNGPANPVSITLTKQSYEPGTEELGYNLLGNPYQAYLDMDEFLSANNLSSYWVYIAESNNYVAGNADASENPVLPSATLHPHQGFFVLANSNNQTVNFNYSTMALETPDAGSYFRGDKVNYPLVNLFATSEDGKKDLTVIEFNRPVFGGSYKMNKVNNANFSLSSHNHGNDYSILFTMEGTEKVPVHFSTYETGTYTMTWSTYHGTFTSLYLVDNMTGAHTNMLQCDHYTFTSSPDDYASRFYITFKCTGVDEYSEADSDFAWFDGNDWIVTGKGQLQLVDMLGRVLKSQYASGDLTRLQLDGYAAGVYMLRLTDGTKSKVQKIVVR